MMEKNDYSGMDEGGADDVLLGKLLHLKGYEVPDASRQIRSKQNIMRRVRQTERKDWSLEHLLELHIPWFFAEPRYGIALLLVVFAGLQFLGSGKVKSGGQGEAYATYPTQVNPSVSLYATASTNQVSYPELPEELKFFPSPAGSGQAIFVGQRIETEK
jgi:hypothetical protein